MSIYAYIEGTSVVNTIIADDNDISLLEGTYIKITEETGIASVDYIYDQENNKFIAPKPYYSWVLNSDFVWESPIGGNPDLLTKVWNEENQEWVTRS